MRKSRECPKIDWIPIQVIFLSHAQCSQDKLWLHQDLDQVKANTDDK